MRKITWLLLALALVLSLAPLAQAAEDPPKVTISSGSSRGLYFRYASTVAELLTQHAGAQAIAAMSAGSVENLVLVQRRTDPRTETFFYGATQLDAAYLAFHGKLDRFKSRPAKETRVLWAMYPDYLHLVAAPGSGINSVADLKGKRVSTGAADSGTEMAAMALLDAAGIRPTDLGFHRHLGLEKSAEGLAQGTLDAFFAVGGLPLPALSDLASALAAKGTPMTLVDLAPDSPAVKALMAKLPGVYQAGTIAKSVYNAKSDDHTLAMWNLMVCHQDVPEEQAYRATKAVFENLATLSAKVKAAKDTTPANSARLVEGPIPFHPGALRYLKEVGAVK